MPSAFYKKAWSAINRHLWDSNPRGETQFGTKQKPLSDSPKEKSAAAASRCQRACTSPRATLSPSSSEQSRRPMWQTGRPWNWQVERTAFTYVQRERALEHLLGPAATMSASSSKGQGRPPPKIIKTVGGICKASVRGICLGICWVSVCVSELKAPNPGPDPRFGEPGPGVQSWGKGVGCKSEVLCYSLALALRILTFLYHSRLESLLFSTTLA